MKYSGMLCGKIGGQSKKFGYVWKDRETLKNIESQGRFVGYIMPAHGK